MANPIRYAGVIFTFFVGVFGAGCSENPGPHSPPDSGVQDGTLGAIKIESVEPASGSITGDTPVVVRGTGLADGVRVRFGPGESTNVVRMSATVLQVRTPPGVAGKVSVTATNPDGQTSTLAQGFEYVGSSQCRLSNAAPALGSSDVPIVTDIKLAWTSELDPGVPAASAVELRDAENTIVPTTITRQDDHTLRVLPDRALHFWGTYTIRVRGLKDAQGQACEEAGLAFSTVRPNEVRPMGLRSASAHAIAKANNYLFTASRLYRGMQVYDATTPDDLKIVAELLIKQTPIGITVSDDRAYLSCLEGGVVIVDVSNPLVPKVLGVAGTPGRATRAVAFARGGRKLLLEADRSFGVRVIDVTNPEGPFEVSSINPVAALKDDVRDVVLDGDTVAIANGEHGFAIASIADLTKPVVVAQQPANFAIAVALDVARDRVFVGGSFRVDSYKLSDVAAPLHTVAFAPYPATASNRDHFVEIAELRSSGSRLYVAAGPPGLLPIDVAADGTMARGSFAATPGRASGFLIDGSHLFAATESGVATYSLPALGKMFTDSAAIGDIGSLALRGERLYAAAGAGGLHTYSLAAPENPALLDRRATEGSTLFDVGPNAIAQSDNLLVLGDGREKFLIFQLDSTGAISDQLATTPAEDGTGPVRFDAQRIYACQSNAGLIIVDLQNPTMPNRIATVPVAHPGPDGGIVGDSCSALAVSGKNLYMGTQHALSALEVGDPAHPITHTIELPARDAFNGLAIKGKWLYAATRANDFEGRFGVRNQLQVFDLSEPLLPRRVWQSSDLGGADDVVVAGDLLFVAAGAQGVYFFDISNPATPVMQGNVPVQGVAVKLAVASGVLYAAERYAGVRVIHTGPLPN